MTGADDVKNALDGVAQLEEIARTVGAAVAAAASWNGRTFGTDLDKAQAGLVALHEKILDARQALSRKLWETDRQGDASAELSALNGDYDVAFMNSEFALVMIGKSPVVLWSRPGAEDSELRFLTVDGFKVLGQNRKFHFEDEQGKKRSISYPEKWLSDPERRVYAGLEFFPNPDGAKGRAGYLNLWRGFAVEPKAEGTCHTFYDHLRTNVCNGCEAHFTWLFAWFAQMVQQPRQKPGTAIILRGGQGTGKTTVGQVFGRLFPSHYVLADDARYLSGNFNSHMANCLLLQADEAVWAGDKGAEGRLKGLTTSAVQMIEQKGVDPVPLDNHVRLLMTSNHDWVVPAGKDERRFAVFDIGDTCAQHHEYFAELWEELDAGGLERLLYDLLKFDLSTVNLRQIPKTLALLEQKLHSLDPLEAWLLDRLQAGAPTRSHRAWPEFVAKQKLMDDYIAASERTGVARRANETQFHTKLRKLLPTLGDSRRVVPSDEGATTERVRVYDLPLLQHCREAFEAAIGQPIVWERADG